jgi:hypothetical protein
MQSYRAEDGRMSLLLFLTHYIRYYNIKLADNLRVTSTATTPVFSRPRKFHTRDGLVQLVPNQTTTYHDPSEIREGLPFNSSHGM